MRNPPPESEADVTDLSESVRDSTRDLILVMADSKRLLGMRYAGWILGAPELETGIACASMAQDEWGHGRLLYALLREFGEDTDRLEHGREAAEYASVEQLDRAPASWPEFVALNAFLDTALSVQFEAFRDSTWIPLRQRVEKMIEEERFHSAHGTAWIRRLAGGSAEARAEMRAAAERVVPAMATWFGPDSPRAADLVASGVADAGPDELRRRYMDRIEPLLAAIGATVDGTPDFDGFDEARRRFRTEGPDEATLRQVRGDKNRVFLMD
jgi:ring-1,2-phenylacetyl-CoA epoxidase subunit PaaC